LFDWHHQYLISDQSKKQDLNPLSSKDLPSLQTVKIVQLQPRPPGIRVASKSLHLLCKIIVSCTNFLIIHTIEYIGISIEKGNLASYLEWYFK